MKKTEVTKSNLLTYFILTLIFITTSILSVLFLYKQYKNKTSLLSIKPFSLEFLAVILLILAFYLLFDCLRFYYILKTLKVKINFIYAFKVTLINEFISNITPFGIGGGIAQIYFLNKKSVSLGDGSAAATIKTVIPTVIFFIATPFAVFGDNSLLNILPASNYLIYVPTLMLLYVLACYLFYRFLKDTMFVKQFLYKFLHFICSKNLITKNKFKGIFEKTAVEIDKFAYDIILFFKGNRTYIFYSIIFSILFFLVLSFIPIVIMKYFNYYIPFLQMLAIQIILSFIIFFSPTPGSSGIAEGGFTVMFSRYVSANDIVSITFLWRFFSLYLVMIIGMIVFYWEMKKV